MQLPDHVAVLTQGSLGNLKETQATLARAGVEAQIVRPDNCGTG